MSSQKYIVSLLLMFITTQFFAQDFVRVGITHDFKQKKLIQTLSIDFNRTEKVDEKAGKFLIFNRNGYYFLPSIDFNIGDGITSSENNILIQALLGKAFFGEKRKNNLSLSSWNKAIELNPSYNSDKLFNEKLTYLQFKAIVNFVNQKSELINQSSYVKNSNSFSFGVFSSNGYRNSETFNTENFYSTLGFLLEYKARILDQDQKEKVIFKISGNYYRIISDVDLLTNSEYAGILTSSIDRRLNDSIYLNLSYKVGNKNLYYQDINVFSLSLKFKY